MRYRVLAVSLPLLLALLWSRCPSGLPPTDRDHDHHRKWKLLVHGDVRVVWVPRHGRSSARSPWAIGEAGGLNVVFGPSWTFLTRTGS